MTDWENVKLEAATPAVYIPVSREWLVAEGLVEPTPEERAQLEREAAESRHRQAERDAKMAKLRARLSAIVITDPLARAVLGLHTEDEHGRCDGDEYSEGEAPDWPCKTVAAIARHYEIELP